MTILKGEIKMTRDDVLTLENGRELDALVAEKVMGYIVNKANAGDFDDGGLYIIEHYRYKPFRPSTNISDAWKVLDKMRETNKRAFTNEMYLIMNPNREAFQIAPIDLIWYMNPLNICKAALLVLLNETP